MPRSFVVIRFLCVGNCLEAKEEDRGMVKTQQCDSSSSDQHFSFEQVTLSGTQHEQETAPPDLDLAAKNSGKPIACEVTDWSQFTSVIDPRVTC